MELAPDQMFRCIKPVDISAVVECVPELEFVNSGGVCAWVTAPGSAAPKPLLRLVNSLAIGGRAARMFCRKLMPGQSIAPHVDKKIEGATHWRRFQVPIVSHPEILMRWPEDGQELHLAPGFLYEVRFDRTHEVVNRTAAERIHIQIDQVGATI